MGTNIAVNSLLTTHMLGRHGLYCLLGVFGLPGFFLFGLFSFWQFSERGDGITQPKVECSVFNLISMRNDWHLKAFKLEWK